MFQPYNAASLDVGSLMHVLSSGGTAERLIPLEKGEVTQRWPQVLPGGAVLFTSHTSTTGGYEGASIVVQPLPTGDRKVLVRDGYYARYLPTGHLVYVHEGTLFAAPFDVERLALTGAAAPVLDGVSTNAGFGGAQYSVAANGTIVYEAGEIRTGGGSRPLILFDRVGTQTVLRSNDEWLEVEYSPDGTRIAATILRDAGINVWVLDTARDIASRLTSGEAESPAWTPDSSRIAYVAGQTGGDIYWQRADGSDSPQQLTNRTSQKENLSFHPSGKWLVFTDRSNQTKTLHDLMVMPLEGNEKEGWKPGQPKEFLNAPIGERFPAFSPDGRWIAYSSNETGESEVYVRPFPGPGGKWQISTRGGAGPAWSRTRPEILYTVPAAGGNFQIMSASYTVKGATFVAERARPWTTALVGDPNWTLHPDGNRIAAAPPSTPSPSSTQNSPKRDKVVLVLNFFDELRRVAPN